MNRKLVKQVPPWQPTQIDHMKMTAKPWSGKPSMVLIVQNKKLMNWKVVGMYGYSSVTYCRLESERMSPRLYASWNMAY